MPLDVSGALLEGIRVSEGNNPYIYPPRNLISNSGQFSSLTNRSEYVLISYSTNPAKKALEIADPDLQFRWTKNESSVSRFSYDSFSKRWLPSPGGAPESLGKLSNQNRLVMPIPDPSITNAPFAVYVGNPVRAITFTVQIVGTEADFTPPTSLASGTVEVSSENGKMNFSQSDVTSYGGDTVWSQRQSFFERKSSTGFFGSLPVSSTVSSYYLFLNPKPATGQIPFVRIGYRNYLTPIEVPNEASLGSPVSGTFTWSLDTGRVRFAAADINSFPEERVYYCGVSIGSVQPSRTTITSVTPWPSVAFNIPTDSIGYIEQRYVVFAESGGSRTYWKVVPVTSSSTRPPDGTAFLDITNGNVYLSASDINSFPGWSYFFLDTLMNIESGVSVQVFRSGINGSGAAQTPDFTIVYFVENQIIVDGISQAPFVMLPTTPIVDSELVYEIQQGISSSGTFTGILVDATDSTKSGLGYFLNLDIHQLSFTFRKHTGTTLQKETSSIKLTDAAIIDRGVVVFRNGGPIIPGTDFEFDAGTGLVNFTDPFGENGPDDISGVNGVITYLSFFDSSSPTFSSTDEGKYLFSSVGQNQGIRKITTVLDPSKIAVSDPFIANGSDTFDIRSKADLIADRFWIEIDPPFKKFSIATAISPSTSYVTLPKSEYQVFANVAQINLSKPALPKEVFLVTYVALVTTDNGATYTSVNTVEKATFKIRLENASSTSDPLVFSFNPEGRSISKTQLPTVYAAGVPQPQSSFVIENSNTLRLVTPVPSGGGVTIDYWVEEALGGETTIQLLAGQADVDFATIAAGSSSTVFNGDQTHSISKNSVLFVNDKDVIAVDSVSYDSAADTTTVNFVGVAVNDSDGGRILSCAPLDDDFYVAETATARTFVYGANSFIIQGDVSSSYQSGTIIRVNGDLYYVSASQFTQDSGTTKITITSTASRNYVIPSVIRSIRPVLFPGISFQTSRQANLDFPLTLIRMGENPAVLISDIDYSVSNGGVIKLEKEIGFGDILYALYVAREIQPVNTSFQFNYAYTVAPNNDNGMLGQRLVSTYNLYSPDTFFYRIETVITFMPEVKDMLLQSAQSSSSGPNTQNATGQSNKDFGKPSLYYGEQHENNIDIVMARLLKFYNDLINLYEDGLSDIDGRIVGGKSGKFRFDGSFSNPPRSTYDSITNDIDDRIKIYDRLQMTGFWSFAEVPVYTNMGTPNPLSRIFPTNAIAPVGLNDKNTILDYGKTIGSIGIDNITSAGLLTSTKSNQFFSSVSGSSYTITENGQPNLSVPPFAAGQDVVVYNEDGVAQSGLLNVVSVTGSGPYTVALSGSVTIQRGSILRDLSNNSNTQNHFYQDGRDLNVHFDSGQITNMYLGLPDIIFKQTQVSGNEVVDIPISFGNAEMAPRRIPVLDGQELNDDGRVPEPRLRRLNESNLLEDELSALSRLGTAASVSGTAQVSTTTNIIINSTLNVAVNDVIVFTAGPHAGQLRMVTNIISSSQFQVDTAFSSSDSTSHPVSSLTLFVSSVITPAVSDSITFLGGPNAGQTVSVTSVSGFRFRVSPNLTSVETGNTYMISSVQPIITTVLAQETEVLNDGIPTSGLIAAVDSEIATATAIIRYSGPTLITGTGTVGPTDTFTDNSVNFVLSKIVPGCLFYVPSGPNRGVYSIINVTSHTLQVDASAPYVVFPTSGSTPYEIIKPESFIDSKQFGFISQFLRETSLFYSQTLTWQSSVVTSGIAARQVQIVARQAQVINNINNLQKIVKDGGLYDTRYLWISQRTNRQEGNFVRKRQAAEKRITDTAKLLASQQKLFVVSQVMSSFS